MTSVFLKFALTIYGVLTAVTLLIHAQPYHNDDLRAFLMPTGCSMPCFMDIRPGVTTLQQALAILESHDSVRDVQIEDMSDANPSGRIVQWFWNNSHPAALYTHLSHELNRMQSQGGIIVQVDIATNFTLADIWLTLGTPKQGGLDFLTNTAYLNNNIYPQLGFRSGSTNLCPFRILDFWNAPQILVFFGNENRTGLNDPAYLSQFTRKFRDEYKLCWSG